MAYKELTKRKFKAKTSQKTHKNQKKALLMETTDRTH